MALSLLGITSTAQVPRNCDVCGGRKKIKWHCIECQVDCDSSERFILCDQCKLRHGRVPSTAKHQIFSISDTESKPNTALLKGKVKKTFCRKHPEETYRLFCKLCKVLACSVCQEEYHIGHVMSSIEVVVEDQLSTQGIEVPKLPTKYLARSPSQDGELLKNQLEMSYSEKGEPKDTEHEAKREDNPDLDLNDDDKISIGVTLLSTITANIPCVYFLKAISSDAAWIGCAESDSAVKVKSNVPKLLQGLASKLEIETEAKQLHIIEILKPLDIAIKSDGTLLIVSQNISYLSLLAKFLQDKKETSDYYSHLNLTPISVCIEKYSGVEKRLWIALKEQGQNFSKGPNSVRKLVGISKTGHVSKVIETAPNGQNIFTIPWRIIHTGDQLCVIDKTDTTSGRVISLTTTGRLLWSYCPKLSADDKQFYPTGIASSNDKVLIIDGPNNTLHILYQNGNVFVIIPLIDFSIERPFSVDVDNCKKIWIGCRHDPHSEKGLSRVHILSIEGL